MALADFAADRDAVQAREHPVEDDEVRLGRADGDEAVGPIVGLDDVMPLLPELTGDELVQVAFVFDH